MIMISSPNIQRSIWLAVLFTTTRVLPAQSNASVVSVTPSSGSGSSQTFSLLYSDTKGFADIGWAEVNINSSLSATSACYVHLDRLTASNHAWLLKDGGSGWDGPVILGLPGSLQNSQCVINSGLSSASGAGNNLTVNLVTIFTSSFAGQKNIYMQTHGYMDSNPTTGWQSRGTWTVSGSGPLPPSAVSVTPASGSGSSHLFSFLYSDPGGYTNLAWAQVNINTTLRALNGCYVHYDRATNAAWLLNDAGTAWNGPLTLGIGGIEQNGQCVLDGNGSSVSGLGTNLTLNLALSFFPKSAPIANTIYMQTQNVSGLWSGGNCWSSSPFPPGCWQSRGNWTVPVGSVNHPPAVVSATPGSGSGSTQTFALIYSDPDGYGDLPWVQVNINYPLSAVNACYVHYAQPSNSVWLLNDLGTAWIGPVALGTLSSVQNSQCFVNASSSSGSGLGTNFTLNLTLTFFPAFSGTRNIYMQTQDSGGVLTGWQSLGSWTVTAGNLPPSVVSVTPNAGSGSAQSFAFLSSDPDGASDLPWVQVNINSTLNALSSCYVHYDRVFNSVWLLNDAASGWLGPIVLGGASNLSNSQCQIAGASSSASPSATNLTLNLSISFLAGFSGPKKIYMQTVDLGGRPTGWQQRGGWTVP
jgi:hypothetical protein